MSKDKRYVLDVESREVLVSFKDSQFYGPIIKLLREIEIKAENEVLGCPIDKEKEIIKCRLQLDGCRRTLGSFQTEINKLSKITEDRIVT